MTDEKAPSGVEGFEEIDLRRYLQVLLRRWKMILGITCVAASAALLISSMSPPVYEAKALVAIVKIKPDITFEPKFKTIGEEELAVLGRLGAKWYEARRKALAEMVKNAAIAREVIDRLRGIFEEKKVEPSYLMEKVEGKAEGDLIAICVKWDDPQQAALIANTWAKLYEEHISKLYIVPPAYSKSIEDELKRAKERYLAAQEALERFISQNKMKEIERLIAEKQKIIKVFQQQLESQLKMLRAYYKGKQELQLLLENAESLCKQIAMGGEGAAITNNIAVILLKSQIFASSAKLPTALAIQIQELPKVKVEDLIKDLETLIRVLKKRLNELDEKIAAVSQQIIAESPLKKTIENLEEEIRALEARLEQEKARQEELIKDRDIAKDTYIVLKRKAAEVNLITRVPGTEVRFAIPAASPLHPVSPRKFLNTAIAGILGLMVAVLGAFLVESLQVSKAEEEKD